jgi:nicotinamide-nucleotide amidase
MEFAVTDFRFPERIHAMAADVLSACRANGLRVATAESCTGGLVAASLTDVAGSSDVVDRAFVTYNDGAKHEMLGVSTALLETVGAVSDEVARAMAEGALAHSHADVAVSVTGIAGPGGGDADKPVGLVFLGIARRGKGATSERRVFAGDRSAVRAGALALALEMLLAHTATGAR